jgi:predicted AAA+ superfamily ATPase
MSLTKQGYLPRIIDAKVADYLGIFGAVSVEGPKWCGKTWTSLNHASSVTYLMDPAGNYSNRARARLNPSLVLTGDKPHAIDEWQEVPGIWDAVRFSVDQTGEVGQFLLTGSATPPRESYEHSGTGRIATLRMRPMSLYESGDSTGAVSLAKLFAGNVIDPFVADLDLRHLIDITVRGGWPQTLSLPVEKAGSISAEYIKSVARNELFNENYSRRNPAKLGRLLRSLARNNATTVSDKTLTLDVDGEDRRDFSQDEIVLSRDSVADYSNDLKKIFVIEDILAWSPAIRSATRLRVAPKRVFADPSLAIAALGLGAEQLFDDLNTFGFMFENLCLRDLAVYAEQMDASLYHYHDNSDLEVDAIIETRDGSWGAFEIKLGEYQIDVAAENLLRMKNKMVAAEIREPSCLVVITGGGFGQLRDDGVYVVPVNALKQ